MIFESKKDLWIGLFIWVAMIWAFISVLFTPGLMIKIVMVLALIFTSWIWFGTNYEILDGTLKVQCGPFKSIIPIKDIKSIKKTNNPLSSAALSLDRLDIRYGRSGMILISPKDRDGFIETVTRENGNIEIKI
jgi:hypothetical protein